MIGSQGGALINDRGDRYYAGAGGAVGGLSAPGRNYAYLVGSGASEYHRFTPVLTESVPCVDCNGGGGPVIVIDPPPPIGGGDTGGGGGGGGTGGGGVTPVTPVSPIGGVRDNTNVSVLQMVQEIIKGNGIPQRTNTGPMFLFTPGTPGESGGFNMKMMLVLVVVGILGFVAYKKFA